MESFGKVQVNNEMVNVLVETRDSNNNHHSHLNHPVLLIGVLSDDEIVQLWEKRNENDKLKLAKDRIKKQDGYAISNCVDNKFGIKSNTIVRYEKL